MDALDEGLESSHKRPGPQAVLGLQDLRPLQDPRFEIQVPDPYARRLQYEPHALFGLSQRVNPQIPLGDVIAGTERADDAAGLVAQQAAAPFERADLAGACENRALRH